MKLPPFPSLVLFGAAITLAATDAAAAPPRTVVDGVHVVDVESGEIRRDRRVVIEGGRIEEILEALRAATLTPAAVLGRSAEHGSIEVGKAAD